MKLVVMGDLHYPDNERNVPELIAARDIFFNQFLKKFFAIEADAHISIGDLTNYGKVSELEDVFAIINNSNRNFYHVLGNHDLYAQTRDEVLRITGQSRYHAVDKEDAIIVFLDTAKELDHANWDGWVDEEQLQWFESIIKSSGTKPMLVFAHHPVFDTTKNSADHNGSINPSIDMWRILNQKKGVGVYFNGHTHVDSIVKKNNWNFVQLSACLDHPAFRVVEFEQDTIRVIPVDVPDEQIRKSASIIYNNINHFKYNPTASGEESERGCVISLKC